MRLTGAALALAAAAASLFPLLMECTATCQPVNHSGWAEGRCPVMLTPVWMRIPGQMYSECVTVRVWMKRDDFLPKDPHIEILSPFKETYRPVMGKRKKKKHNRRTKILCDTHSNNTFAMWEFVYDCIDVEEDGIVSVSYRTSSASCNVSHTVIDRPPEFDLSVDRPSKSISVTVGGEDKVYTRWCYKKTPWECVGLSPSTQITIDPSQSPSAVLNISLLLPCVCVEVYHTHIDAFRKTKCPFQKETDVGDVWLSSEVTLFESSLLWSSKCPASNFNISASLCWMQHTHLCTPVLNSTLAAQEDGLNLIYNTSAVDKHPQMCVQFSLQGSNSISCPFPAEVSSWEVNIEPGRQSVFVYVTSVVPATFSAQLCVLNGVGCSPTGPVHALKMEGKTTETWINMPPHFLAEKQCVQVWQSDPALQGRRILCLDNTHYRCGLYAVAVLILVVVFVSLGTFLYCLTKNGAAGWLYLQRPVLLVCSSEQSAHVSAVCALASILQGELSAMVHVALCTQSSQKQTGAGTGVADLGPLPWLYGQWEAVRKAQGNVLIIWSPEAKTTHEKWREERENMDENERKKEDERTRVDVEEQYKLHGSKLEKCKKVKAAEGKDGLELYDEEDWSPQGDSSSVIGPVFAAALACLQGTLQQCKVQGVAIVYFEGLCHSRDIPKALRGVPRYGLPQDFRGLIQELGGMKRRTESGKSRWHCWPRLLCKVRSVWLARQLAHRLQTLVPQTQGRKLQGRSAAPPQTMPSDKTPSGLKLLPDASTAEPDTVLAPLCA